jgi:hypothetical protein
MVNLKAEWDRCSQTYGGEPTYEQWYAWTLELLRGERRKQSKGRSKACVLPARLPRRLIAPGISS